MDEALAEDLSWSFSGYDMATEGSRGVRRGLGCRDEIGCLYENDDDALKLGAGR